MLKKLSLLIVVVLSAISLSAQTLQKDDITMLVVPREKIPLQIAQDISRRYPVVIVSYQQVQGDLQLHAWNGDSWVGVSKEDYTSGTFFTTPPKHAIVLENERMRAPEILVPHSTWCASANRLTSTDPRVMIHLLGLHFDFPFRHWDQFAKRYGYELEEINPALDNVHWWDLRGDILLEKRANRDFSANLDQWYVLEPIPAPVTEPVIAEATEPMVATPAVPSEPEPGATAVDIKAKAPEPGDIRPAPAAEPSAVLKPAPVMEPAPMIKTAPVIETEKATKPAPAEEPAATVAADPFSSEEIPAAEIVVPPEPKKPWWKLF
jgi:hypothetical protein